MEFAPAGHTFTGAFSTAMPQEYVSLAPKTTMKTGGFARYFFSVQNEDEVALAVQFAHEHDLPLFVLGGGSNIVVSDDGFPGVVIEMAIQGVEFEDRGTEVFVHTGAGVRWDDLVRATTERALWGLENLSCIPGSVGATPVQNIGAYGAEAKDTIVSVRAYDVQRKEFVEFDRDTCDFGYRMSMFKRAGWGRFVITRASYKLSYTGSPDLSYRDLAEHFDGVAHETITSNDVRTAVCAIRARKLPDPAVLPNTGSFFKNPTITHSEFSRLQERFPGIGGRETADGIKLSAAQLIDLCGWRGKRFGDAGVYEQHALVLVNHGEAAAHAIVDLARTIADDVYAHTNVALECEVEFVE